MHPGRAGGGVFFTQKITQIKISHDPQAMIMGNHHDIVVSGQSCSVVHDILWRDISTAVAGGKAAAMRVEHHRPALAVGHSLSPDVQVKAVLIRDSGASIPWASSDRAAE